MCLCHLGTFRNNVEVEMAGCELLWIQESSFYCDGIFKLLPRCGMYINVLRDCGEK
jgi:hypothetical protein